MDRDKLPDDLSQEAPDVLVDAVRGLEEEHESIKEEHKSLKRDMDKLEENHIHRDAIKRVLLKYRIPSDRADEIIEEMEAYDERIKAASDE